MANPVTVFVRDLLERAVKTAAQAALLVQGAGHLNVLHADWRLTLGMAGGGFVTSVLTSLASQPWGNQASASVLSLKEPTPTTAVVEANEIYPMH